MGNNKKSRIEQIEVLVAQLEEKKITREVFEIEKKKILDTSPINKRNKIISIVIIVILGILFLFLIITFVMALVSPLLPKSSSNLEINNQVNTQDNKKTTTPTPIINLTTKTPTPTLGPTNTNTPTPSPSPIPFIEPIIPELTAIDVYGNLEDKGFTCEKKGMVQPPISVVWTCTDSASDYDYTVQIFAGSSMQIYSVTSTALNFTSKSNTEASGDFLSYIATLSYKDAKPTEARDWVRNNMESHDKSIVISNVKFAIFGQAKAKILKINHQDSTLD
jgi:hypothetical protein